MGHFKTCTTIPNLTLSSPVPSVGKIASFFPRSRSYKDVVTGFTIAEESTGPPASGVKRKDKGQ